MGIWSKIFTSGASELVKDVGSVVDDLHSSVVADIKKVREKEEVILVHGGGKEVTKVTEQLGKEPKFVVSPTETMIPPLGTDDTLIS